MSELFADSLRYRYPTSDHDIFTDVSLRFRAGDCVLLVGDNGSGKSTLGRALCGLLKLSDGKVWVDGKPLPRPAGHRIRTAYYVGQNVRDYLVGATLLEEIRFSLRVSGRNKLDVPLLSDYWLPAGNSEPLMLTDSEAWRLAMLIASAVHPLFLFIDEVPSLANERNLMVLKQLLEYRAGEGLITCLCYQRNITSGFSWIKRYMIANGCMKEY